MAKHRKRPNRTLRLEKPRGLADREPERRVAKGEPTVTSSATLDIGAGDVEVPILNSQAELQKDIAKIKKFLRDGFKKLTGR